MSLIDQSVTFSIRSRRQHSTQLISNVLVVFLARWWPENGSANFKWSVLAKFYQLFLNVNSGLSTIFSLRQWWTLEIFSHVILITFEKQQVNSKRINSWFAMIGGVINFGGPFGGTYYLQCSKLNFFQSCPLATLSYKIVARHKILVAIKTNKQQQQKYTRLV